MRTHNSEYPEIGFAQSAPIMELIPAIDLLDGEVVRLKRGEFNDKTTYELDPQQLAMRYQAAGACSLHVVDLNAARSGDFYHQAIMKELTQSGLSVQMGGGLRSLEAAKRCLEWGVKRLVIGSLAVTDPVRTRQIIDWCGVDQVVLALDVRLLDASLVPYLATHGWINQTSVSLWDLLTEYPQVRHVLCTDVSRDGALKGPNIALYREARQRFPNIHWQASGGVASINDLNELNAVGVHAAICGKALLDGHVTLEGARSFLPNASFLA
jgi:phosphoribosylformimino-5-aminoimidazole carboxamide ribotide isomerase